MFDKKLTTFDQRFRPYHDRLYGYAIALARDRDVARELLHDCVARALAARDVPAEDRAFRAWLFRILRNLWIDRGRTIRRSDGLTEPLEDDETLALPCEPVSLETAVVNAFAVRQAFARLGPDHREVLALVDISGFSYEETAAILVVPVGTVMSRVSRARGRLADMLSDLGIEEMKQRDGLRR